MAPRSLKAPVSSYFPLTKGLMDVGFPTAPPLEPNLTALFGVKQASTVAARRPLLSSPGDQVVVRQTDRMHQCAFQASAAANKHRSAVSRHSETIRAALHALGGDRGKCCWMLQSARMKTAAEQGSMSAGSSLLSAPSGSARSHGIRARCRGLLFLTYRLIPDIPPTHDHNKPTSAVITPGVDSTAHTSTHPLSVYSPHDESRSARSVWRLPRSPFGPGQPWVASRAAVARALAWLVTMTTTAHHEHVYPLSKYFSEWQRMWTDGQMDEQADQQRVHSAVRLSPARSSMGYRKHSCHPRNSVLRSIQRCRNQGSSKGGKSGVFYSRYFLNIYRNSLQVFPDPLFLERLSFFVIWDSAVSLDSLRRMTLNCRDQEKHRLI